MQRIHKFTYTLAAIFVAVGFLLYSFVVGGGVGVTYAATSSTATQTAYEQQNVLDDLKGSTLNGTEFDLSNYIFNEKGTPEIVSFVEFCYSSRTSKQSDYGLYLYLYNPQGLEFDINTSRNKIQFAYGEKANWNKYVLQFLNYSTESGYEGLFYKFKIVLSDRQRSDILNTLSQNSRIYEISGVELSIGGVVTDYCINYNDEPNKILKYTYSGYAEGYGSDLATEDTLTCTVDGVGETLSLNVHSTYWRPSGTNGNAYARDTLHSVYFSVPNRIIEKYGEMSAVHATWLNAHTAPIFVTGNSDIYNALLPYIAQYVYGGNFHYVSDDNSNTDLIYSLIASKYIESASWNHASHNMSYLSYNVNKYGNIADEIIYYLNYLFLADDGNADDYVLPAELLVGDKEKGIKGWFETFTEKFDSWGLGNKFPDGLDGNEIVTGADPFFVNDKYSRALFDYYDSSFTDMNIEANYEFKLTDEIISQDLWQKFVGGGYNVSGKNEYKVSAIQPVTKDDISFYSTKTAFCEKFYIAESDYDEFCKYVTSAEKQEETVYLFRYYQSEYTHYEVAEYKRGKGDWTLAGTEFDYDFVDTNAYFMQMWVQLDFDIIDVSFTKNGVTTVIPVVMSPMDIAADGGKTLFPTDDGFDLKKLLLMIMGIIALLIVIVILGYTGILPLVVQGIIWLILLPFRLVGWTAKGIKQAVNKHKKE